jgi:hypothetical protein
MKGRKAGEREEKRKDAKKEEREGRNKVRK